MDQLLRILIVDDSLSMCQVLKAQLEQFGAHTVDYCHDGVAALEQINDSYSGYDALFVDLHMEGMDGLELLSQLNTRAYRGAVVIVSALDSRIIEYSLEIISNYNLRLLGSLAKPIDRSVIGFMMRRIRNSKSVVQTREELPSRRKVEAALHADNIQLYFQPIIANEHNSIHSFECLSRLTIDGTLMQPSQFLPVIDKFDLHDLFLSSLLKKVIPEYKKINSELHSDANLAINLSPKLLFNDDLPITLASWVDNLGVERSKICFEITEDYSLNDDIQQKNLNRLRIQGFKLALDDYGTGYTNLRQIRQLPLNEIKLDRDLVMGMHQDKILRIVVESVQRLCEELQLNVIAEGVCDPKDLIALNSMGINHFQGYLFCRPKPAGEVIRWVKHWQKAIAQSKAADQKIIEQRQK